MWHPATEIEHQVKPEGLKLGKLVNNFKKNSHDKKKEKKKLAEKRFFIDPNNSTPCILPQNIMYPILVNLGLEFIIHHKTQAKF